MTQARDKANIPSLNFSSTGIDDNATSTAITIDSSENVGIGTASPAEKLEVHGTEASGGVEILLVNEGDGGISTTPYTSIKSLLNSVRDGGEIRFGRDSNYGSAGTADSNLQFYTALDSTNTERMRINSSGNVGIGETAPLGKLHVKTADTGATSVSGNANELVIENTGNVGITLQSDNSGTGNLYFGDVANGSIGRVSYDHSSNFMSFNTNAAERLRITSAGDVGIGLTNPAHKLSVFDSSTGIVARFATTGNRSLDISSADNGAYAGAHWNRDINSAGGIHTWSIEGTERMRINSSGQVLVAGTTAGDSVSKIIVDNGASTSTYGFRHQGGGRYMRMGCPNSSYAYWETNTTAGFFIGGNTFVNGTLSKSSGSFKIDHPLPEKTNTHHLVHSFVESPQADNIYRGKIDLVNGTTTVNIDTIAGMSEGTFVLLNREIQCFTSNETGWTAVKGSVSGNTLTITAQDNTCTDTISWMVIGERQDQHMYDTNWTDENGKVIVEPLKETDLPTTT